MLTPPKTQSELPGITEGSNPGVPVAVVPLWHAVVTAKLAFPPDLEQVRQAQGRLDAAQVEAIYPLDPGGILTRGRAVLPGRREGPGS